MTSLFNIRIIRMVAVFSALLIIATPTFAQNLSTYEQKRIKLADETFTEMSIIIEMGTYDETLSAVLSLATRPSFDNKLMAMYYVEGLIERFAKASSPDISLIDDSSKEKIKKSYNTWKIKRQNLDRTRTQADIDRERKYKSVDGTIDKMILIVKMQFEKWAEKGKYEKTAEYQNRLNTKGIAVFDSICDAIVGTKISLSSPAIKIEKHYDADNEQYISTIIYGDDSYKGRIYGTCSIPPDKAKKVNYELGTVTTIRVDGKWLVPVETEYEDDEFKYKYEGECNVMKTVFSSTAKTVPLCICFKDIEFDYSEISEELKNHCFSNEEYNAALRARYDSLNSVNEKLRARLNQLKSKSKWFEDFHYEGRLSKYLDDPLFFKHIRSKSMLNKNCNESKYSHKELDYYEEALKRATKDLDAAEREYYREYYNTLTDNFWRNIETRIHTNDVDGNIKEIASGEKQTIFKISKNEQVRGIFYKNTIKNADGNSYTGKYSYKIRCTKDKKLMLYYDPPYISVGGLVVADGDTYRLYKIDHRYTEERQLSPEEEENLKGDQMINIGVTKTAQKKDVDNKTKNGENRTETNRENESLGNNAKLRYPNKGFRCFVDVGLGGGLETDYTQINASAIFGCQIFPLLFVGGGIGVYDYFTEDEEDKKGKMTKPEFEELTAIPLFGYARCDFIKAKVSPFVGVSLGTSFGDLNDTFYALSAGCRISRVSLALEYENQNYNNVSGLVDSKFNSISFKAMIDFGARKNR